MRSHIPLGRIFGIRIGLHFSWFLIALLIVFSLSAQFRLVNPAWPAGREAEVILPTKGKRLVHLAGARKYSHRLIHKKRRPKKCP